MDIPHDSGPLGFPDQPEYSPPFIPKPRASKESNITIPTPIDATMIRDLEIKNPTGNLRFKSAAEMVACIDDVTPIKFVKEFRSALSESHQNSELILRVPLSFTMAPAAKREVMATAQNVALSDRRPLTVISSGPDTTNFIRVWPHSEQPQFRLTHKRHGMCWTEVPGGIVLSRDRLSMIDARKFSDQFSDTECGFTFHIEDLSLLDSKARREVRHSAWMRRLSSGKGDLQEVQSQIEIANFSAPLILTSANFFETKTVTIETAALTPDQLTKLAPKLIDFANQMAAVSDQPMRLRCEAKSENSPRDSLTLLGSANPYDYPESWNYALYETGIDRYGRRKQVDSWGGTLTFPNRDENSGGSHEPA